MARPATISTGQWADLSLEETCRTAKNMEYEELEIASWGQINLQKAAESLEYIRDLKGTLEKCGLGCWVIGAHLPGQCVGDVWDPRLDGFAPAELAGKPDEIRAWGIQRLEYAVMAAKAMGVGVVTGFMGPPIWKVWYSFPQTTEEMVKAGPQQIKGLWTLIFDVSGKCSVKFALEVHPMEIAFDYYSTRELLEMFECRGALGINFDLSHLVWQGMDPAMFLYDFADRIYHVHIRGAAVNLNGGNGILGSHITFGDPKWGWSFVSLDHGDVGFDKIIRILNVKGYNGPLSVEWEDSGMDRILGGTEACAFTEKINFSPSATTFDDALKTK